MKDNLKSISAILLLVVIFVVLLLIGIFASYKIGVKDGQEAPYHNYKNLEDANHYNDGICDDPYCVGGNYGNEVGRLKYINTVVNGDGILCHIFECDVCHRLYVFPHSLDIRYYTYPKPDEGVFIPEYTNLEEHKKWIEEYKK